MAKRSRGARIRNWGDNKHSEYTHERRRFRGTEGRPKDLAPLNIVAFTDIESNARVVSPYGALVFVRRDGEEVLCRVADALMQGKSSILAPGDNVLVVMEDDQPVVQAVAPRTSKLSRPSVGKGTEQFIAANVEQLVIVAAIAQPVFKQGIVDRYLIAAEVGGVKPVLCVNKMDLNIEIPDVVREYERLGLPVVYTSCKVQSGLDSLRDILRGKLSVLTGHSGVGKSSLINALNPGLDLSTREVSRFNEKGQHTTTTSRLYEFDNIHIIDTPGVRQLGLWGVSLEEVRLYFPDLVELSGNCKFRDCTHLHEPGCAVRTAVEEQTFSALRYASYCRIRASIIDGRRSY